MKNPLRASGIPESVEQYQLALGAAFAAGKASVPTSAQPDQVNAMLVEALGKLLPMARRHGTLFGSSNPWTDACDLGDAALTAAKQAQPVCGYDDETGNCTRMNCCKQAQPEPVTYTPPKIIDPDAPHPCFN